MNLSNRKMFVVSHAPFWHDGSTITERSYHTMYAALPAIIFGFFQFGMPAVSVMALAIASAILWELAMNRLLKRPITIGDGNAAVIGMLFGMLAPATLPWWAVITGTLIAIVIGKQIYGGIGANPFNPACVAIAILMASWRHLFDFDGMLVNYDFAFSAAEPLAALKNQGVAAVDQLNWMSLLLGAQTGGLGATFGLGLIAGGVYLILRGFIRWEISVTFLAAVAITASLFQQADPTRFAGPAIHLFCGYTLIGAFFLATEDSSSPVNTVPMLIYGAGCGVLTVLIRNIGAYSDGVILAILMMNIVNPLLDKIRPQAIGKVM
jgi:electron transport complex protein RnfD